MAEFVRSIAAQRAASIIVETARKAGLLEEAVAISPRLAEAEKELIIKMLSSIHDRIERNPDMELSADEVGSLFTFVFAKAAESVTNMFNHKTDAFELTGMFDGRIPVYADDSITNEFKNSPFPFSCAENYLQWVENDAQHLVGCDMTLLLFEALKWCFRLSCHYAMTIVENK